jgi:hypothetical protein
MIRKLTALASVGLVLATSTTPVAAQDAAPRVFTRTGQWQLEAAEEECRIARVFTNGDQQIALALERNRADPLVRMVLVTNALSTYRRADELGYRFEPAGEQRSARYITAEMADGQTYYNLGNVLLAAMPAPGTPPPAPGAPQPVYDRAAEQAFAAGITGIEFNQGLTQPVRLETGSLRAAITALQACEDDLLRTWGLDWEKHQTMTRRAVPDGRASDWIPAGTIGFGDFPSLSAGRNPFRVMVSAEGQPTDCKALWASLDASKNERVCNAIMEHGRFLPALDAAGQPMASYWIVDYLFGLAPPPPGR